MRGIGVRTVLGALALGLAITTVTAGTSGPARATPNAYPGKPGRIAFVNRGDIFTIEPGGTGLTRLPGDGPRHRPAGVADGKKIAYIDVGNLWAMNANGS